MFDNLYNRSLRLSIQTEAFVLEMKFNFSDLKNEVQLSVDIVSHIEQFESLDTSLRCAHSGCQADNSNQALQVYPDTSSWYCFKCQTGGDVISYEANRQDIEYHEAVLDLAHQYNIDVEEYCTDSEEYIKQYKKSASISQILCDYEEFTIAALQPAHIEYLTTRGLTQQSIESFRIGYTPANMTVFMDRYNDSDLLDTGLFANGSNGLYPVLGDRITVPTRYGDKPKYFVGADITGETGIKYKNQLVTDYVSNSFWVYGSASAKLRDGRTLKPVLLVEGVVDGLLSAQELSDEYLILATDSCDVSKQKQLEFERLLRGHSLRKVYVCFDNDENGAGWDGAKRATLKLHETIRVALIKYQAKSDDDDGLETEVDTDKMEEMIKDKSFSPRYMPTLKMTLLRKPKEFKSIDVADYIKFGLKAELKEMISKSVSVEYYDKMLVGDEVRFFEEASRGYHALKDSRIVDELMFDGDYFLKRGTLLRYEDGVYVDCNDKNQLNQSISGMLGDKRSAALINRCVNLVESTASFLPQGYTENEGTCWVNTKSGWIDISQPFSKDYVPQQHNPFNVSFTKLPIEFNPETISADWSDFLFDVLAPGDVDEFQKALGYTLVTHAKYEKIFVLVGTGGNGKGTALKLIQALLGEESYSQVSLGKLGDSNKGKFKTFKLYGKLANFDMDGSDYVSETDDIKKISSGEAIEFEKKGKDSFEFIPYCTPWVACNDMPKTKDRSDAWLDRLLVFGFDRRFRGTESQNLNLINELVSPENLSSLFNFAWQGYNRLLVEGFKPTKRSMELKTQYQEENDIVKSFVNRYVVPTPDVKIARSDIWNAFRLFMASENFTAKMTKNMFFKGMRQEYPDCQQGAETTNSLGKRERALTGIDLSGDIDELDIGQPDTTSEISL